LRGAGSASPLYLLAHHDVEHHVKTQRHAAILRIVREHRVPSQARLRDLLAKAGIHVTQATLSRDMHELGLAKIADPDGHQHYAAPPEELLPAPSLETFLRSLLLKVDGVGPLLVLTTTTGSAGALAAALDHEEWPGIIGTIAGDDNLLVVAKSSAARQHLARRFRDLLAGVH
jgi:transcriptional regulator of arginine metabolism